MSNWLKDLKISFITNNMTFKLVMVNLFVFVFYNIGYVTELLFSTTANYSDSVAHFIALPSLPAAILRQPWAYVSYQFFHMDLWHVAFNMFILYYMGNLFEEYTGNKRLLPLYLLSGISGGILYQLGYNFIPAFSAVNAHAILMGASASIMGIMVATAILIPHHIVYLFGIIQVQLRWLVLVLVLLSYINIPKGNAGGEFSHLGGALFGAIFLWQLKRGNDITKWLQNILTIASPRQKAPMKVVKNRGLTDEQYNERKKIMDEAVDRILDKINQSGFNSLTKEEKEILYRSSNRKT